MQKGRWLAVAQSDKCMQAAEGDSGKMQVCDDQYSECLNSCEGGG